MTTRVSIAIPTNNRPLQLTACLTSIARQTIKSANVYVFDADKHATAASVCLSFKKILPISYHTGIYNVAQARSAALRTARSRYLGFTDDDCILSSRWVESGLHALAKHTNASYVLGNSLLGNIQNNFALAQHHHDWYWFMKKISPGNVVHPLNCDTKNLFLDRVRVTKKVTSFDSRFFATSFDSSDADFGYQLTRSGLTGVYDHTMVITHNDNVDKNRFLARAFQRGRMAYKLTQKWNLKYDYVFHPEISLIRWVMRLVHLPKEWNNYFGGVSGYSIQKKLLLWFLIKLYQRTLLNGYYYEEHTTKQ